jgi:hypothetical protein
MSVIDTYRHRVHIVLTKIGLTHLSPLCRNSELLRRIRDQVPNAYAEAAKIFAAAALKAAGLDAPNESGSGLNRHSFCALKG